MCHVLVANEFTKRTDLERAQDPAEWLEACRLSVEEIEFLRKVKHVGCTVPRWFFFNVHCIDSCGVSLLLLQVTSVFTTQEENADGRT